VFENRVLRRILGPRRDSVTGEWRKLHNDKLHNLYSSPSIIRIIKSSRMKLAGQIERMEENRGACKVGMSEGKRKLGRPNSTCTDSIKSHWIGRPLVLIQRLWQGSGSGEIRPTA
jgi:hypothetical protein